MMQNQSTPAVSRSTNIKPSTLLPQKREAIYEYKSASLKINNINVHVKNSFYQSKKNLHDILFAIVITKLKEKPA